MGQDLNSDIDTQAKLLREKLILADDEFLTLFNYMVKLVVHEYAEAEDVPLSLYVIEYRPPEEIEILKNTLAAQQNMSRADFDELLNTTGAMIVPMSLFEPTEEQFKNKRKWIYDVGMNFNGIPTAVFAASSTWATFKEKQEDFTVPPSEDPERKELFMMLGTTLDGKNRTEFWPIDRTNGKYALNKEGMTVDASLNMLSIFWHGFADGHAPNTGKPSTQDPNEFGKPQAGEA